MVFYLIGIDYKTAPLGVRESLYRRRKELNAYLADGHSKRAAVFYTCNRCELYGVAKNLSEAVVSINIFRGRFIEFSNHGYIILGRKEVLRHLLRLATGLESQIKGELEIFRQLSAWYLQDSFPEAFFGLVHKALSSGQDIRISSGLDRIENNIATFVSGDLAKQLGTEERREIVIVGTGKIAGLFAVNRHPQFYLYFAGHKNYFRAQELAERSQGEALMLQDLPEALLRVDALISASSSPHFLFDRDYFRNVLGQRRKPLYLYDLAIPRDIDPVVADLKGIVLNNLETLTGVFEEHNKKQGLNLLLAEEMIEEAVKECGEIAYGEYFEARHAAQPFSVTTS